VIAVVSGDRKPSNVPVEISIQANAAPSPSPPKAAR